MNTNQVATRTRDFLSGLGVNTHLTGWLEGYAGSALRGAPASAVIADLDYLGIHTLRDGLPEQTSKAEFAAIAAAGNKFDIVMGGGQSYSPSAYLPGLEALGSSLVSVEGPNEINIVPVIYNGTTGISAALAFQADLYAAVRNDPALGGVPVYNLTEDGWGRGAYQPLGDMSAVADYGTAHAYARNDNPAYQANQQPGLALAYALDAASVANPGRPMVVTETGYNSAFLAGGVDPATQAKYELDMLADAAKAGVKATFLYELTDDNPDPTQSYAENHWGLFDGDGKPKPVATAIHNLTSLLADPASAAATFTPSSLQFSVSGGDATTNSLLMQKSGGIYELVLWAEPDIWKDGAAIPAPVQTLGVTLGGIARGTVYDPLQGSAPVSSSSGTSFSVQVSDHPVVLELSLNPRMVAQAGDQRLGSGASFSFMLPGGLFADPAGGTVSYTAQGSGNSQLPPWLKFDPATLGFSGSVPSGGAATEVVIVAHAAGGAAAAQSFHLYGMASTPVLASQQGDIRVAAGRSFSSTVPAAAFTDPAGGNVRYSMTQADGSALPSWASFDKASLTLSGTAPSASATNQFFVVTATSASGGSAAEAFHLYGSALSLDQQAPDQRLAAGTPFTFKLPAGSFGTGGVAASLSSRLDTLSALPSWLSFDANSGTWSGTTPMASVSVGVRVDAVDGYGGHVAEAFHIYTR